MKTFTDRQIHTDKLYSCDAMILRYETTSQVHGEYSKGKKGKTVVTDNNDRFYGGEMKNLRPHLYFSESYGFYLDPTGCLQWLSVLTQP